MNQSLEDKLKKLEREIAVKNAYLTINFSFPKGCKLPDDVKEQVIGELKNACTALAEDVADKRDAQKDMTTERLNDEEIRILRQVAATVKSKTGGQPIPAPAQSVPATQTEAPTATPREPLPNKVFDAGQDGVRRAMLLTLDNVQPQYRNRINPEEEVYVTSIKDDGFARISVKRTGLSINVPTEDLEFLK